jgi:hypothetical protein
MPYGDKSYTSLPTNFVSEMFFMLDFKNTTTVQDVKSCVWQINAFRICTDDYGQK